MYDSVIKIGLANESKRQYKTKKGRIISVSNCWDIYSKYAMKIWSVSSFSYHYLLFFPFTVLFSLLTRVKCAPFECLSIHDSIIIECVLNESFCILFLVLGAPLFSCIIFSLPWWYFSLVPFLTSLLLSIMICLHFLNQHVTMYHNTDIVCYISACKFNSTPCLVECSVDRNLQSSIRLIWYSLMIKHLESTLMICQCFRKGLFHI